MTFWTMDVFKRFIEEKLIKHPWFIENKKDPKKSIWLFGEDTIPIESKRKSYDITDQISSADYINLITKIHVHKLVIATKNLLLIL
jgi:hypothetical protein